MQFIKASDEDLDYLADVLESILPMYRDLIPGAFERQIEKFRIERKLPVNYEIWLILNECETIGFFGIESLTSEDVYLAAFYLHSDFHRMKFGSMVLEGLCNRLEMDGYKQLLLFAHQGAHWAINFYLQNGFTIVTEDIFEIRRYKEGILADYFLPKPVLMRRVFQENTKTD